jgi:hypothetical protein
MADALTYLSRVADRAGMVEISADLLSIRKRLALKAKDRSFGSRSEPSASRRTKPHSRQSR